jgi:hypothetical protein
MRGELEVLQQGRCPTLWPIFPFDMLLAQWVLSEVFVASGQYNASCCCAGSDEHIKIIGAFHAAGEARTVVDSQKKQVAARLLHDCDESGDAVECIRVVEVLSNPAVSERWRLLEAQHLRKLAIEDLIFKEDAGSWSELFLQLLDFTAAIQENGLALTSGVLQVLIMAAGTQVDPQLLPLSLVSTIVASFSSVVAEAPCFFTEGTAEYLRASKWTDVAVALDIIGNLLSIIVRTAGSGKSSAAAALGNVKICFVNISKLCLRFPTIEPSEHAVAHVACWSCLSNCCSQALQEGRQSGVSGLILELLMQIDVLSVLLER